MKKYCILLLLFGCFGVLSAQEVPMTPSQIDLFTTEVIQKNKDIKTISTEFIQNKNISFLSKEIESKGDMLVEVPHKLLWRYTSPIAYSVLFDKQKISINDQGKKNNIDLGNNKKFSKINNLIVSSISGQMFDDTEFTIQYFKEKDRRIAKMKPLSKELKSYISEIVLYFEANQNTVGEVKLIEPSGDYTRIVFVKKKLNVKIDEKSFRN